MGNFLDDEQTRWQDDYGQVLFPVHSADQCLNDNGCTIHGPSDHSMVDFPQLWRGDRGIMERVCPHEIGHPDPDDPKLLGEHGWAEGVHGCDGCCGDPVAQAIIAKNQNKERQMDESTLHYLKSKVANALMRYHGWDRREPSNKLEFDPSNPNSQYSMMYQDADVAVGVLLDTLMDLDIEEKLTGEPSPVLGVVHPDAKVDHGEPDHHHDHDHDHHHDHIVEETENPNIQLQDRRFVFLGASEGQPTYVGDVREWLAIVDSSGIPDTAELEGQLHLSYDYQNPEPPKLF